MNVHYIDKKELTKEVGDWAARVREQIANGEKPEKMTDYIGEAVWMICNNLALRSNFNNYTYLDEMIGDAIENCVRYLKAFDSSKSNNAFGYITTIASRAFIRRIAKENATYAKYMDMVRDVFSDHEVRDSLMASSKEDVGYEPYIKQMLSILDNMDIEKPQPPSPKKQKEEIPSVIEEMMTEEEY